MICKNCKKEIQGTPKFCPYCGTPVVESSSEKPESTKKASGKDFEKAEMLKYLIFAPMAFYCLIFLIDLPFGKIFFQAGYGGIYVFLMLILAGLIGAEWMLVWQPFASGDLRKAQVFSAILGGASVFIAFFCFGGGQPMTGLGFLGAGVANFLFRIRSN